MPSMADLRPAQTIKATELAAQLLAAAQRQADVSTHIQKAAADLYQKSAPGAPAPGAPALGVQQ